MERNKRERVGEFERGVEKGDEREIWGSGWGLDVVLSNGVLRKVEVVCGDLGEEEEGEEGCGVDKEVWEGLGG